MDRISVTELCFRISAHYDILGADRSTELRFVALDSEQSGGITFCDDFTSSGTRTRRPIECLDAPPPASISIEECQDHARRIRESRASVIVCDPLFRDLELPNKTLVLTVHPRLVFMELVAAFRESKPKIHPTAVLEDCVRLGADVSIGAHSVLGGPGFGIWRMRDGSLREFPQIGGVVLGDRVTVKANVCIDRGALGDTVIGAGTRIDNLCHIAHNCQIGRNVVIVANSMIAGSVVIGDDAWIAPHASILNGVRLGKECVVGMGAIVLADVPDGAKVKGVWKG